MASVPSVVPPVRAIKNFSRQKLSKVDFSGQELIHANFRLATLTECNFTNANLSFASFEGAELWGTDFTGAKLYRANFIDANLRNVKMHPKDCFGIKLSMECKTFDDLRISSLWWHSLIFMLISSQVEEKDKETRDKIILALGPEKMLRLRQLFSNRAF